MRGKGREGSRRRKAEGNSGGGRIGEGTLVRRWEKEGVVRRGGVTGV